MPSVMVGWSLAEGRNDLDLDSFVRDLKARYSRFYADPIEHREQRDRGQGVVCIGPRLDNDQKLFAHPAILAGMQGSPSLAEACAGFRPGRLDAASMLAVTRLAEGGYDNFDAINPPFSVVWIDTNKSLMGAAVDGLGKQQLYQFTDGESTVVASRMWPILRLLGLNPAIDYDAWRYWFVRGWFNRDNTGFSNVKVLGPGEWIVCGPEGCRRDTVPALRKWVAVRESMGDKELLDRAIDGFSRFLTYHQAETAGAVADLSGGTDTRAICSAIVSSGLPCTFTTSGSSLSHDVIIARRIAKRLGLSWTHQTELDSTSSDFSSWPALLECFRRMAVWSEGTVEPNRVEHFQSDPHSMPRGPHFSGGDAGLSKGDYYRFGLLGQPDALASTLIERFENGIAKNAAGLLAPGGAEAVVGMLGEELELGRQFGSRGFELLDFHQINSRKRRWSGAHVAASFFDDKVSAFLHLEHIALAFAMPPAAKARSVYQRAIIQRFRPELNSLPVNGELYLSKVWRWLPRVRRVGWVNRRFSPPTGSDRIRQFAQPYLNAMLSSDSPVFNVVDRKVARARCAAYLNGEQSNFYFVLRLISFDVWYSEFFE